MALEDYRPWPVTEVQDLGEQMPWDGDHCQLEYDVVAMLHGLGTDLYQLFAQRGH